MMSPTDLDYPQESGPLQRDCSPSLLVESENLGTGNGAGGAGAGGVFPCIVADPPWHIECLGSPGKGGFGSNKKPLGSKPLPYPSMSIWEIAAMRVPSARHAHLYMWTINSYVEAAYMIARAWGFQPVQLLSWIKSPMGLGHGGTFCNTTEFILFARRGNLKAKRRVDRTWFGWPRGEHSQKPEEFQSIVESVSPGPYLELFARRKRVGWMHYGNQVASDIALGPLGGGGRGEGENLPATEAKENDPSSATPSRQAAPSTRKL